MFTVVLLRTLQIWEQPTIYQSQNKNLWCIIQWNTAQEKKETTGVCKTIGMKYKHINLNEKKCILCVSTHAKTKKRGNSQNKGAEIKSGCLGMTSCARP